MKKLTFHERKERRIMRQHGVQRRFLGRMMIDAGSWFQRHHECNDCHVVRANCLFTTRKDGFKVWICDRCYMANNHCDVCGAVGSTRFAYGLHVCGTCPASLPELAKATVDPVKHINIPCQPVDIDIEAEQPLLAERLRVLRLVLGNKDTTIFDAVQAGELLGIKVDFRIVSKA